MANIAGYPYYDDFDASKNYHKILFHPAKPVQARELTQIQSIIQEQIRKQGNHFFKNGTMVIPGHVFYDEKTVFLKIESSYNQVDIDTNLDSLIGLKVVGDVTGVEALVVHGTKRDATDGTTLFIKYTASNGDIQAFQSGETLSVPELAGVAIKISPVTVYTGKSSICTVNDGVYYVNGYFVGVNRQSIVVSKYGEVANAVVGLDVIESVVTEKEDDSLYDNAAGFSNYGAPGAHRLKIDLTLSSKAVDYVAEAGTTIKFVDLLQIKDGAIQYMNNETKYAELEKYLAKRTYEESGDYVVRPFSFKAIDYRDNSRGLWASGAPYLSGDIVSSNAKSYVAMNTGYAGGNAPAHAYGVVSDGSIYWIQVSDPRPYHNVGQFKATSNDLNVHKADDANFVLVTSPGKAYVNGYSVEFTSPSFSIAPKARETQNVERGQLYTPIGDYALVTNIKGIPSLSNSLVKANILDVDGKTVGTTWIRNVETSVNSGEYKLYMFLLEMYSGKSFAHDAHSVTHATFEATFIPYVYQIAGVATSTVRPTTAITAMSWSAGVVTLTATGHETYFDDHVTITGVTPAAYNGTFPATVVDGNTIQYALAVDPGAVSVQGDVTPVGSIVNGTGASFDFDTVVSDRIRINGVWGKIVQIINPTQIVTSGVHVATSLNMYIGTTVKKYTGPYIVQISSNAMQTLRTATGGIDTEYVISKADTFSTGAGETSVIRTASGGEKYMPAGHIVIVDTGTIGTSGAVAAITTLNIDSTQLTISGLSQNTTYKAILVVKRSGSAAKEKTKTIATKTIILTQTVVIDESTGATISNAPYTFASQTIGLTEADCIKINRVTLSGSSTEKETYVAAGETDVTSYFYGFDSGQREDHYGMGKVNSRTSFSRPLKITFDYYQHSSGDYFSVDSYANVPKYLIEKTTKLGNNAFYLPNCLDFRSRISDDGTTFDNAQGGLVSEPLHSEHTIDTSYSFYKPRIDAFVLNTEGKFVYNVDGNSTPGMVLCDVKVSPFTLDAETGVTFMNKQIATYTMSRISRIEDRVKNVEYFVALSELERQTLGVSVKDQFGLERTKAGIVVDDFSAMNVGDVRNDDFRCTIDPANRMLRAQAYLDVVCIQEPNDITNAARRANHYQVTGSMVSLPYAEKSLTSQRVITFPEYVQAYSVIDFGGFMKVYPYQDVFTDSVSSNVGTEVVVDDVVTTNSVAVDVYVPKPIINPVILDNLNTAMTDAAQAIQDALNAKTSADAAQASADSAQIDATSALTNAAAAQTTANDAMATANNAQVDINVHAASYHAPPPPPPRPQNRE